MDRPSRLAGLLLRTPCVNRLARLAARPLLDREGIVTQEMRLGPETLFVPDLFRNIDRGGDGRPDAFCFGITGGWFSQDLYNIEVWINGKAVPAEQILIRNHAAQQPIERPIVGAEKPIPFLPGRPIEVICAGRPMGRGLNILSILLKGTMIDLPVPVLPVLVRGGEVSIPILDPAFDPKLLPRPDRERELTCHYVPHIHYDMVWLRDRATLEELGLRNLAEALRLMDRSPEMTFVIDQGPHVESLRLRRPDLFDRLVSLVREGRIELVNGLWSEPDTYVPSLESLPPRSRRWQNYAARTFGRTSRVAWLIDSFGLSPQMPQILVKSGTTALVYSRTEPDAVVPSEFLWVGLDGTKILAAHLPRMYFAAYPLDLDTDRGLYQLWRAASALGKRSACNQAFLPAGIDHGRPQDASALIAEHNRRNPRGRIIYSTPTRFFESIKGSALAEVKAELGPDLTGCYGSRVATKRLNRAAEASLREAEYAGAWAWIAGRGSRADELDPAWERALSYQFHDSIAGPIPDEVAADVDREFGEARRISSSVRDRCLDDLAASVEPVPEPRGFLVLNPLPFPRRDLVRVSFRPGEGERAFEVVGPEGEVLPHQVIGRHAFADGDLYDVTLGFIADLPAAGYKAYGVRPAAGPGPDIGSPARVSSVELAGKRLRAIIDPRDGTLRAMERPGENRINMRRGAALALQRDFGSLYYAVPFGRLREERGPCSITILQSGPLLASMVVDGRIGRGRFRRTYTLTQCSPVLGVDIELDFADPGRRAIVRFPTDISGPTWRNEVPGGFVIHGRGEHASLSMSDLTGEAGGLSLINDGVPGHGRRGSELRLILHRSTDLIHFFRSGKGALGVGKHSARLGLLPHGPDFAASAAWRAAAAFLHPPLVARIDPGTRGSMPRTGSLLSLEPDGLLADALYVEGDELVLRFHETAGAKQRGVIESGFKPIAARLTDLLGRTTQEIRPSRRIEIPVGPCEIVTLRLKAR